MWKKVDDYALNFHSTPRQFAIHLKLEDGTDAVMAHLSLDEFSVLCSILNQEQNVWYHSVRGDIVAHTAPQYEEGLD